MSNQPVQLHPVMRNVAEPHHSTRYDKENATQWFFMESRPRPCFTPRLLRESIQFQKELGERISQPGADPVNYLVLASKAPGVFNLGGDLQLFQEHIKTKNREGLYHYAKQCIETLYPFTTGLGKRVTTISLVQGDALGGGFEAAMSSNVLIAERSARMGLPEVMFNLFPGMGACSFLSRKLGVVEAQRLIASGKVYTAEEMHELGVVDILAEDSKGDEAVYEFIHKHSKFRNGHQALHDAMNCVNPVTFEELMSIIDVWVDAAMRLDTRDLRMMNRLVERQTKKKERMAEAS